jgi:putative membrane protein
MKKTILNLFIIAALCSFNVPLKFSADNAFVIKAAQSNIAEIEAAKLALVKSTSDSVKTFAQRMIDDHTTALIELVTIAKQKSFAIPDSADDEHRMLKQRMMLISGKSFDSAYIKSQVKDHIQAVDLFRSEISNGTNEQVKAYAVKLLPKLQMHLEHVQHLASSYLQGMNQQQ